MSADACGRDMQSSDSPSPDCHALSTRTESQTAGTRGNSPPLLYHADPTSLPLFADSFCPSADFSAIAAVIEEEEDEQRQRETLRREETKLRRTHRTQRRQAAQPYSREAARTPAKKASKPTPIQPPLTPALQLPASTAESEQAETLTAGEAALFLHMWRIDRQAD